MKNKKSIEKELEQDMKSLYKELLNDANKCEFGIYMGDGLYLGEDGELHDEDDE